MFEVEKIEQRWSALFNELSAKVREALACDFDQIISEHPEVARVGFTAYTPYFNDGEECVFGVHGVGVSLDSRANVWEMDYVYESAWEDETKVAAQKCEFVVNQIPAGLLKTTFGDHIYVTYTPENGFDVSDYEHD